MQAAEPEVLSGESESGDEKWLQKRFKEAEDVPDSEDDDPAASTTAVAAVPTFPFV